MAKRKLNYRFHNPNPVEVTADYILKVMIEVNTEKVEKAIRVKMQTITEKKYNDKTEARLDKISNTKILEMNEYADGVLKEINRNHNEVMFMYDMLNEKDKEIKTTVKDVNVTRMNRGYAYNDAKQQSAMEEPKIVMQDIEDFVLDESLSTHDKIRQLYSNGYNDVEIAKRLKIGVGEVRLVINLSSGNN